VDGPEKALPAIMEKTNTIAGCRLDGIEYHRPRLDDVFVAHTGRSLKDEPPAPAET
jgi:ABC-2 type transport system ATP-binding protein